MTEQRRIIYLDQNRWSDLAKCALGRGKSSQYGGVLRYLQEGVRSDRLVVPLSSTHIHETISCSSLNLRRAIGALMVQLSQGYMLASMYRTILNEVVALSNCLAANGEFESVIFPDAIGWTLQHAFCDDANEWRNLRTAMTVERRRALNCRVLYKILVQNAGIDQNTRELITNSRELRLQYVAKAEAFRRREEFTGGNGGKRRLNTMYAANLCALLPLLDECLPNEGADLDTFVSMGPKWMSEFLRCAPTLDVMIALQDIKDRNRQKKIEPNDVIDLSFLAVAIPYCDIVVTEPSWATHAKNCKLEERYGTKVIADLMDLPRVIEEL